MAIHEHVFGDDAPFAQCHASTLVALPDGGILSAWFGGTGEGNADVAIWGARRSVSGWSAPGIVARVRDDPHWNPVLFRVGDAIHLHFKVGSSISSWETWHSVSCDGGRSWSTPRELVPGDRGGRGAVKNKPIRLADGSLLAGASLETRRRWTAFADRSEDGGRTWQASAPVRPRFTILEGKGVIQPALWESAPGHVHMLLRSSCGHVCRSDSDDGGHTWTRARKTALPNNNSGIDLARLDGGELALVFNPVSASWGPRTPLRVALSRDGGLTWPQGLDLEVEAGEFSYPAVIALGEELAITYTWNRRRISFWRGSVEEVRAGLSPGSPGRRHRAADRARGTRPPAA